MENYIYVTHPASRGAKTRKINIYKLDPETHRPRFVKEIKYNPASTRGEASEVYNAITGKDNGGLYIDYVVAW